LFKGAGSRLREWAKFIESGMANPRLAVKRRAPPTSFLDGGLNGWREMALGHVDRLLPYQHTEEPGESDQRRRRRADLDKAIGGAHRQPHEERDKVPKHRDLPYS
jgi:hypothetical protein